MSALDNKPFWSPLKDALQAGNSCVNWLTIDAPNSVMAIGFEAGHGSHTVQDIDVDTNFQSYLVHVLQPLIIKGVISDGRDPGSFDDRKLRWSNTTGIDLFDPESHTVKLSVGPTWFQQCQADIQRTPVDALNLMLHGLETHGDPYACFARGMGIVVVPLTRDGHAFIGRRSKTTEYSNAYCFVAGWASFDSDICNIDPYRDLERELREEICYPSSVQPQSCQFIGLAGHPLTSEVDLVFVAQTDLSDNHFAQGQWPEHASWQAIRNRAEAQQLLDGVDERCDVMFSSRFCLHYLINNYWKI